MRNRLAQQQEEGPGPKAKLSSQSFLFISSTNKDTPNLGISTLWGSSLPAVHNYAAAKSLQSCPTLCDPIDSSPAGSPIPGILQARTLEWVAISFSNA